MPIIAFEIKETNFFTIIYFSIEKPIQPSDLQSLTIPSVNLMKGIVLSGRGPIWLYCYLAHHFHPSKFVATHDPRLGGAVITETHDLNYKIGEIIPLEET